MLRTSLIAAGAVIFGAFAVAQQIETDIQPVFGAVKNGGIYHVATGTWTRNVPTGINLGPDVVYNNTANSGFYTSGGIASQTASFEFVDEGRIPSTTGGAGAGCNRDNYNINGIEIGYCVGPDNGLNGPLDVEVTLYQTYQPCTDPAAAIIAGAYMGTGLPQGGAAGACWTVQLDLTGAETCLLGDGDGVFDADPDFDSFGLGFEFDPGGAGGYVGAIAVGPLLKGDRNWTVRAQGEMSPITPHGGGGDTYYGPAETCVPTAGGFNSSGYDAQDSWWVGDRTATAQPAGCFWFGGYNDADGCNANVNVTGSPFTALHSVLFADSTTNCFSGPTLGILPFCDPGNNNSSAAPAVMVGSYNPGVGSGLHLEINGGVPLEFGYILAGTATNTTSPVALSDGLLCISVTAPNVLGRYNVAGTAQNSIGSFDATGLFQNIVGTSTVGTGFDVPANVPIPGNPLIVPGSTWHFQGWYRDGIAGTGHSNLTNGLSVTF